MIFLNSASSAAALVFYLPGVCTHTDTKGKQSKDRVRNILKSLEKTQYLMNHPVASTNANDLIEAPLVIFYFKVLDHTGK